MWSGREGEKERKERREGDLLLEPVYGGGGGQRLSAAADADRVVQYVLVYSVGAGAVGRAEAEVVVWAHVYYALSSLGVHEGPVVVVRDALHQLDLSARTARDGAVEAVADAAVPVVVVEGLERLVQRHKALQFNDIPVLELINSINK